MKKRVYKDLCVCSEKDWFNAFDTVFDVMIEKHFKKITKDVKNTLYWFYNKVYTDFTKEFDYDEVTYAEIDKERWQVRVICVDKKYNSYTKLVKFFTVWELRNLPFGKGSISIYEYIKLYHKYNNSGKYLGSKRSDASYYEINSFICDCFEIVFRKFIPQLCGKYLNAPMLEEGFVKDYISWDKRKMGNFKEFIDTISGDSGKDLFGTKIKLNTLDDILFNPSISDIRRETGNTNKKSFDFIEIEIPFSTRVDSSKVKGILTENKDKIIRKCLAFLETQKKFTKFGVPSSYLQMTKWVMTKDSRVMLIFELKKIDEVNDLKNLKKTSLF